MVKSVLGFVKRQNEKYQFVENLATKIGYPYWDKATIIPGKARENSRIDSDSANTVFIPFVLDNGNTVNTTLIVKTSPSDTNFLLIADWEYANRFYGPPSIDSTAENVALLFMMEDHNVFGYNRFTVTDSNLFRTVPVLPNSTGREIRLDNRNARLGSQNRIALEYEVEVCFNTYVCNYPDWCSEHGGCDYMNCATNVNPCYLQSSICWTYYYNIGSGEWSNSSDGGPVGGGSGGGWNNWDPPVCEGPTGGRINQYEDCDPGWTPPGIIVPIEAPPLPPYVINNLTRPCLISALTKLSSGATNTFFKQIYNIFDTSSNIHLFITEADLADTAYGIASSPLTIPSGLSYTITLDTIKLLNCSQEWMVYVLIHEVAHASMFANVIQWDTANSQHDAMMSQYLTQMATSLTAAYPGLSLFDAYSLCYTGFNNSIDGITTDPSLLYIMLKQVKEKLNDHTIMAQQLISRGAEYSESGTKGLRTGCN